MIFQDFLLHNCCRSMSSVAHSERVAMSSLSRFAYCSNHYLSSVSTNQISFLQFLADIEIVSSHVGCYMYTKRS